MVVEVASVVPAANAPTSTSPPTDSTTHMHSATSASPIPMFSLLLRLPFVALTVVTIPDGIYGKSSFENLGLPC